MPKLRFPNHWKGGNGLYCAGFSRSGLMGISLDAQQIATDIGLAWKGASKWSKVEKYGSSVVCMVSELGFSVLN